jgi:hypothetical protein
VKALALVLAVLVLPTQTQAQPQTLSQAQNQPVDRDRDQAQRVFRFADPAITEASGLVDLGSVMVTANDSGHAPVLHVVDATTGRTAGRVRYADAVTDVEALAPATGSSVWVGDIGDNRRRRSSVRVFLVPTGGGGLRADSYQLRYPDGPKDAEALFTGPDGRLHVVSKGVLGGAVYAAPVPLDPHRPNRLRRVHPAPPLVTDAAAFPGSTVVLLRDYVGATAVDLATGAALGELALPAQRQGEAISVGPDDRVRVTSEGAHAEVLEVATPSWLRRAVAGSRRTTAAVAGVRAGAILIP